MVKPKKNYSWVNYIKDRLHNRNKNFLVSIIGKTGSGKSWSALSIGELVDENFSVDNVCFKASEIMKLINSGKVSPGSVIIWDEAGVELSSRNWQSTLNKIINFVMQTFRHKNLCLIFTVPYADFVDVSTRKLFHAEFETVSINRTNNTCSIKPKILQYNSALKKWYRKYLKVIKKGQGVAKIKKWKVPKPSSKLIKEYEYKKNLFTKRLNSNIQAQLEEFQEGKPLTDRQKSIVKCWEKGMFKQLDISKETGIKQGTISDNIKYMRRKGYRVEDYNENKQYNTQKT